jgi:hypothetical protein
MISEKVRAKYAEDIEKARALGNQYDPDIYGRFPWDRSERRGKPTTLTKTVLGEFCYAVLSVGGELSSFWAFSPKYVRSSVFIRVQLTIAQKERLEAETPFRFDPPPVARV